MPIQRLKEKITEYRNKFGMKSLMTKKSKQKDGREGAGAGAGAGAGVGGAGAGIGGASAADSEDLGAHGYEVKLDIMVDNKGGTLEPFFKVWRQFCTYDTVLTLVPRCRRISSLYFDGPTRARNSSQRKFARNRANLRSSNFLITFSRDLSTLSRCWIRSRCSQGRGQFSRKWTQSLTVS